MTSVKILHTADLHLGAAVEFLKSKSASRKAETLLTFETIVKTAIQNNVEVFLIAGDLFDSNGVDNAFIKAIFSAVSNAAEIKFIYSAGNHDPLDITSPFRKNDIPKNFYILDTSDSSFTFDDIKLRVYGKSFKEIYCDGQAEFSINPPEDDYVNIMCIHGDLSNDGSSPYNAISADFIRNSGMDYIALGHIHKRSDIAKLGNTYFAYCGCPEGQGFDESGEKGVYIGTVTKGNADLQFYKTAKRTLIRENVDISAALTSENATDIIVSQLKEKYGNDFGENLYRITLLGETEESASISGAEILARLDGVVYFAKIKDKTTVKLDYETLKAEPSLKGVFVKKMLEKIDNCADKTEKENLLYALSLGLRAFTSEVMPDEN